MTGDESLELTDINLEEEVKDNLEQKSFKKINDILGDKEDKKSERIQELKSEYESDKGLSMMASLAVEVLDSDKFSQEQKDQVTQKLSEQFSFINQDDYKDKTTEEKTELASAAIINTATICATKENGDPDKEFSNNITASLTKSLETSAPEICEQAEEVKKITSFQKIVDQSNKIKNYFYPADKKDEEELDENKKKLSPEERLAVREKEQKMWNDTLDLARPGAKAGLCLALMIAVPPPAGLIAAGAAFFLVRNIGTENKNQEAKTNDYFDKKIEEFFGNQSDSPKVTTDFGYKDKDPETNLGKSAQKFTNENQNDLNQEKDELRTTKTSLENSNVSRTSDDDKSKENQAEKHSSKINDETKGVLDKMVEEISKVAAEGKPNETNQAPVVNHQASEGQSR